MLSSSTFGILKQKALQGLQNNLEHVGFHSERLENTVLKSDDPHVTQLTRELQMVVDALKSLSKSATQFHSSIKPITEANTTVEEAMSKLGLAEDVPLRSNARDMAQATNAAVLLKDLQELVVDPIDKSLSWLTDLKARVMQRSILELELRRCEEVMDVLKVKMPGSAKLSEADDNCAQKLVRYHQFNLSLMDDLDNLRAERYEMVHKLLMELQKCQQRFFTAAATSMQTLCNAELELPCADLPEPVIETTEQVTSSSDTDSHPFDHEADAGPCDDLIDEEEKSAGGMGAGSDRDDLSEFDESDKCDSNRDDESELHESDQVQCISSESPADAPSTDLGVEESCSVHSNAAENTTTVQLDEQLVDDQDDSKASDSEVNQPLVEERDAHSLDFGFGGEPSLMECAAPEPPKQQLLPPLADMLLPTPAVAAATQLIESDMGLDDDESENEEQVAAEDALAMSEISTFPQLESLHLDEEQNEQDEEEQQEVQEEESEAGDVLEYDVNVDEIEDGNTSAEEVEDDEDLGELSHEELLQFV